MSYVQRRLAQARQRTVGTAEIRPFPGFNPEQLQYLAELYPPRCYRPGDETLEQHLMYAGRVALVDQMVQAQDTMDKERDTSEEPINPLDRLDIERA